MTPRVPALAVHALTASGAGLALLALLAAIDGRFDHAFLWLGLAAVVDGVDGALARRTRVAVHAPEIDGEILDLVVDYATYVFVPVVILLRADVLPAAIELPVALVVLVSAALYFADKRMKTDDAWFRGFPGLWNVVAFYVVVFAPPPVAAAVIVLALAALQFAPIAVAHPVRVRRLRLVTLAITALWAAAAAVVAFSGLRVELWSGAILLGGLCLALELWFLLVCV